ncbi:antirestriction protein ArdA [Streptococcus gwangjuense]|uniref:antirestriction protein ArdA n=1 Tax=Streptococcus gwangjuensis TaxID=1433513 RepID=UPI0023059947|nr:antirestriction protein ArdA [Streptococcus gwangjuense]MDB0075218.1 antirestriction protein ArdA [Streptococcus gwangjuense]
MDLIALIMDTRSKKVKQFSLPADVEYIASEFGYDREDVVFTIQSIEELTALNCEGLTLELANELAENVEDVDEDLVLSFIESESSDPKYLASVEFDDCSLYSDVATDRELGEYLVEEVGVELSKEKLLLYIDYEKFGRDVRLEEGGSFVDKGYFVSR